MPTRPRKSRIKPTRTHRARSLRHESPIPERILWSILRDSRLEGHKFRRQHAVGPYFVDFYCAQSRLAVELDGLSHVGRGHADDRRTKYLRKQGLRVIRFTNDDLLASPDAVAHAILQAIHDNPRTPPPLPP